MSRVRLTVRVGPKVRRADFDRLAEALDALEQEMRALHLRRFGRRPSG
jgi:hypothetical protein